MKKKKVLITGSNGLIGKACIKLLSNYDLILIKRKFCKTKFIKKNENIIYLDLSEKIDFSKIPKDIDSIIHLAQAKNYKNFPEEAFDIFQVNVFSTLQLLEFARKNNVKSFIYASSGSVYGKNQENFYDEKTLQFSYELNFYSKSKITSELLVSSYKKYFSTIILRFFFVYGPEQRSEMFIPTIIKNIYNEKEIFLDKKDGIKLNPIYVDDAALAVIRALKLKGNYEINVAGEEILSIREICEIINGFLKKKILWNVLNRKPLHILANIEKMKKLLCVPKMTMKEGLKKVIQANIF